MWLGCNGCNGKAAWLGCRDLFKTTRHAVGSLWFACVAWTEMIGTRMQLRRSPGSAKHSSATSPFMALTTGYL